MVVHVLRTFTCPSDVIEHACRMLYSTRASAAHRAQWSRSPCVILSSARRLKFCSSQNNLFIPLTIRSRTQTNVQRPPRRYGTCHVASPHIDKPIRYAIRRRRGNPRRRRGGRRQRRGGRRTGRRRETGTFGVHVLQRNLRVFAKKIVLCRADDRRATPPSAHLRLLLAEADRRLG